MERVAVRPTAGTFSPGPTSSYTVAPPPIQAPSPIVTPSATVTGPPRHIFAPAPITAARPTTAPSANPYARADLSTRFDHNTPSQVCARPDLCTWTNPDGLMQMSRRVDPGCRPNHVDASSALCIRTSDEQSRVLRTGSGLLTTQRALHHAIVRSGPLPVPPLSVGRSLDPHVRPCSRLPSRAALRNVPPLIDRLMCG